MNGATRMVADKSESMYFLSEPPYCEIRPLLSSVPHLHPYRAWPAAGI